MTVQTTTHLKLKYPSATDPLTPFDYIEFLNNNFDKIDSMKKLGNLGVYNAAEYIDATTGQFEWADILTDAATDGNLAKGLCVYFPAGVYPLAYSEVTNAHLTDYMGIGVTETTPSLMLVGEKGAVIQTGTIGQDIVDMLKITDIDNVIIRGLTFTGNADNDSTCATTAIRIIDCDFVHIENCFINKVANGIMVDDDTASRDSSKIWIINNRIKDYFLKGINCDLVADVNISGNQIEVADSFGFPTTTAGASGIEYKPGDGNEVQTCRIENNNIILPRRNGIVLNNNASASVAPNVVFVVGNTIENAGNFSDPTSETTKATRGSGIYSTLVSNLIIARNTIVDPLSCGIQISAAAQLSIVDNLIYMMKYRTTGYESLHGIDIANCDDAVIRNNNIRSAYDTDVLEPWTSSGYRQAIYAYSSDDISIIGNTIDTWFMTVNTCLRCIIERNVIDKMANATSVQKITFTSSTIAKQLVTNYLVSPSAMSLVIASGKTNQAAIVEDADNNGIAVSMGRSTATDAYSEVKFNMAMPARISDQVYRLKVPIRSAGAAITGGAIVLSIGGFSLDGNTATQSYMSTFTVSVGSLAIPASTYAPSIFEIDIPATIMPTTKTELMLRLQRSDTQTVAMHVFGVIVAPEVTMLNGSNV